jgi:hypothetical protein
LNGVGEFTFTLECRLKRRRVIDDEDFADSLFQLPVEFSLGFLLYFRFSLGTED